MEKLTCSSCNGELELDEKHEIATCKYCGTKYKLDGDKTIVVNMPDLSNVNPKEIDKAIKIPVIVICSIALVVVITIATITFTSIKKSNVSRYNLDFAFSNGTQNPVFVGETLDKVINKNKTNEKHKITVVYNDKETQNEDEILEIKKNLTQRIAVYATYEVKLYYDKDGYVNKIVIEG